MGDDKPSKLISTALSLEYEQNEVSFIQLSYLIFLIFYRRDMHVQNLRKNIPDTTLIKETPEKQEWQVPIRISVSSTPLYIKVTLTSGFPQIGP